MSTKKQGLIKVCAQICTVGLLAAAIGGCHAEARLGTPQAKTEPPAAPPPPAPPPAPAPPEPPKLAPIKALGRVHLTDTKIVINEQVQFDQNQAVIKPESNALLDEIAKTIKDNEKIKKVQIEGHTSSEGDATSNMKLSEDRAKAVMKALTDRGIDAKRLTSKGFGVTKPIETNDTPTGRIANRRVEFLITDPAPAGGATATAVPKK